MVPWSVVMVPARALDCVSVISSLNFNGGMLQYNENGDDYFSVGSALNQRVWLNLTKHNFTNMETGLLHLHNLLRWVILILLVFSIYKAYVGQRTKKVFDPADKKVWLFAMITAHITLLLGLYQWLLGRYGLFTFPVPEGTSRMKDPFLRFFQVEHPISMLVAILLITLGYGMAKKPVPDAVKYKKAFRYFLIALVLILAVVPWPFRGDVLGRSLFPGM